jgi:hypothetical protein
MSANGPHVCYRGCACGRRMDYGAPPHVCSGSFCTTCSSGNGYSAAVYSSFAKAFLLFVAVVAGFLMLGAVGYGFVSLFPESMRVPSAFVLMLGFPALLVALAASWNRMPEWRAKVLASLGTAIRRSARAGTYRLSGSAIPDARTTVRRNVK